MTINLHHKSIRYCLKILTLCFFLCFSSCASVPPETVTLSKTVGSDLAVLQQSHENITKLYYARIKTSINNFIDDVYKPFILNFVLSKQLEEFKKGNESLFTSLNNAATSTDKESADAALNDMTEFLSDATAQIAAKRKELLNPIVTQETQVLQSINDSYGNIIYANSTLTGYLESLQKIKQTQNKALSVITGVKNTDSIVRSKLLKLSTVVNTAIDEGKTIDSKVGNVQDHIDDFIKKIKELTNNK